MQNFIGWAFQPHIMNNSYKTVCDNSDTNLYANSVLRCTPEFLYLEVLLELFKEQFNQPSFLNIQCWKLFCIRQKSELTVIFFIVKSDESEWLWIFIPREIQSVPFPYLSLYSLTFFASIWLPYTLLTTKKESVRCIL